MAEEKNARGPKVVMRDLSGSVMKLTAVGDKWFRDTLMVHQTPIREGTKLVYTFDPSDPLGRHQIHPSSKMPVCAVKCGMHDAGGKNPFISPMGSNDPLITIVLDAVSKAEDTAGEIGVLMNKGTAGLLAEFIEKSHKYHGVNLDDIRWVTTTRCYPAKGKYPNMKQKGNWCRMFAVQDLATYRPKLVMPVGSNALGLLSHKSNAWDWAGKTLTYRGWPDDWLTDPNFALPRPHPSKEDQSIVGHPLFGPPPDWRIPMYPIQAPRMVYMSQNPEEIRKWKESIIKGLKLAKDGIKPKNYDRPWYHLTNNPNEVAEALLWLSEHPGTTVCYDTETTGLRPWLGHKIVFMMFRWVDDKGAPHSIGFPWDYDTSPLKSCIGELSPVVLEALYASNVGGHNITFDVLFTAATVLGADLNRLADAAQWDTWHMAYTARQQRGTLGLEAVAYDFAPDLAGYEEEMTLLIGLHGDLLDPKNDKGGHYANCPVEKWETHFKPYVMGDVEVCYTAREAIQEKLNNSKVYKIPLAHPGMRGRFRWFLPPSRAWVYDSIMSPSAQVLMKMMGRGLYVDQEELAHQEHIFPIMVNESRDKMKVVTPEVENWCQTMAEEEPGWTLDLENKSTLRTILFEVLNLPVQRLTKTGKQKYGDSEEAVLALSREQQLEYAALDKFTLNKLSVGHPEVRPLQDYRKVFKQYSTYVRPVRNIMTAGIDKKKRVKDRNLGDDGFIHGSFLLTGTRGGRLASRDPNLQQLPNDSIVKRMFSSRFGKRGCLYTADFSQIELRLLAAVSGDSNMIEAYEKEMDLHSLTTARIFGLDYEQFSKENMKKLQDKGKVKEAKELELKRKIGKCVDPLTWIQVNRKLVRIGSFSPSSLSPNTFYKVPDCVLTSQHGELVSLKHFYYNGIGDRLLVCSRFGLIACSKTHQFLMKDGSLVQAQYLKPKDILCEPVPFVLFEGQRVILPINPFLSKITASGPFFVEINDDLAYLVGVFLGDGNSNKNSITIAVGHGPKFARWRQSLLNSFERVGISATCNIGKPRKDGSACDTVYAGSRHAQSVFKTLGVVGEDTKKKFCIPDYMMDAPRSVRLSMLAGLIDTDGSIARSGSIEITSKSWQLIQDILVLLSSCGLHASLESSYNKTYDRYYFRVRIAKRSAIHLKEYLRCHWKKDSITPPVFGYEVLKDNEVKLILALEEGPLVDVEVDSSEHLYVANGLVTHNTCNFLTGYGGGALGLQTTLANAQVYLPIEECEDIIDKFFSSYSTLKEYLAYYKQFIMDAGVAVSIFGRVRIFNEVFGEDREAIGKALRAGANHLIQATASDMMLICLHVIEALMRSERLESILVSTVHDSLLIDAVMTELPKIHEIVDQVLNNIPDVLKLVFGDDYDTSWCLIPFGGDSSVGLNYLDQIAIGKSKPDWDELLNFKKG